MAGVETALQVSKDGWELLLWTELVCLLQTLTFRFRRAVWLAVPGSDRDKLGPHSLGRS